MLKKFCLAEGKLAETSVEDAQVYIYINPDAQEKSFLINQYLIDEHTLNSSLDPEELGRIEFESSHLAAIVKRPKRYDFHDNFLFKVSSIGLFLFAEKLVLIFGSEEFLYDSRVFSKMHSVRDVFLRVIFNCALHFEDHLRVIRKISDELELEINQAVSNKDLLNMFKLEKSLVYYLDAINSNSKVTEKLKASSVKLGFSQDVCEFLDDLIIEGNQCFQQAESYSQVLSSMMDAWASIINNNLNVRLKRLTLLSICIMTPTLVVSLFSMNVQLPLPQGGTIFPFWIVSGMAAFSVVLVLLLGHYKKL